MVYNKFDIKKEKKQMKTLKVTHNEQTEIVDILGVPASTRLVPRIARQAAAIAFPGKYPVAVTDVDAGIEYRLSSVKPNSHRKYRRTEGGKWTAKTALNKESE